MPELPEVEIIKRFLTQKIVGKKIQDIKVLKPKMFVGDYKKIIGTKVVSVSRRAKVLFIKLSNNKNLMIHLKLTGQLVLVAKAEKEVVLGHPIPFAGTKLPAKTTHIIISFNGGALFYNDLRQFGWIKVVDEKIVKKEKEKFGPEPFSKEFSLDYLQNIFSRSQKAIKLVLMDQQKIAGLGNIYANDALFEAGIKPSRSAKSLKEKEIKRLKQAILKVLREGIKYKGSSEQTYIQPTGKPGSYQYHFRVYQREGKKCKKCSQLIKRVKLGGRGTFYCPKCQK